MQETVLDWPSLAERTPADERSSPSKFDKGWRETKQELKSLMEKMGVDRWYLEDVTGLHGDPGVIVRWTENGVDHAVASDQEVKEAFRELVKKTHTDVGGDADEFKKVKRAKEQMLGGD